MRNFSSVNGLILSGILISGKTELKHLFSTIDYIDRTIPSRDEINTSLSIFISLGWVAFDDGKISVLKKGKKVGRKHFNFFMDLFKSIIDTQISFREFLQQKTYHLSKVEFKEYYSESDYNEALTNYEDFISKAWKLNPEKQSKFVNKINKKLGFYDGCHHIEVKNIVKFLEDGFYYKINHNEFFVNYFDCAKNFKTEKGGSGKCIADRDSTVLRYVFYTDKAKTKLRCKKYKQFEFIRNKINASGFTTYDLS